MGTCGKCYKDNVELSSPSCAEKPETIGSAVPMGMYHCPDCGAMLLAGLQHPDLCKDCQIEKFKECPDGWQLWDKDKPPNGTILVMFMVSKVFPIGAIVQADSYEVQCGVLGDTCPTFWRPVIVV